MRVLFICRSNNGEPSIIIKNQAESLVSKGIAIDYFLLENNGFIGYLKSILKLKRKKNQFTYDLYHAHYSFSGFVASLAGLEPLCVSLMGTDINGGRIMKYSVRIFAKLFRWKKIIVKSAQMKKLLNLKLAEVIPNGVDTHNFQELDKIQSQHKLGWDSDSVHILFAANPSVKEKNFPLAQQAIARLDDKPIHLHTLGSIPHNILKFWYNASDVILLTSISEGSPNTIKEAMACSRPIVSSDTGDVKSLIVSLDGCYIAENSAEDFASKISLAIEYERIHKKTKGRNRIFETGIDSDNIAIKIIYIYKLLINKKDDRSSV